MISEFMSLVFHVTIAVYDTDWLSLAKQGPQNQTTTKKDFYLLKFRCCLCMFQKEKQCLGLAS